MDDVFEILFGLIAICVGGFVVLVMPILSLVTWRRSLQLERDLATLRQEFALLKRAAAAPVVPVAVDVAPLPQPEPPSSPAPEPAAAESPPPAPAAQATPDLAEAEPLAGPEQAAPETGAPPRDFEGRLGGRIYGWLGAIALSLAGIFLVKYSIEQGWLSPAVRVGLGILLGLVLLGVAQWMRVRSGNLGQALTAASVAVLYASLFAATALYGLIPTAAAFALLAGLTFAAIALALREGPFVALVGLAGGFLTPAFVSSGGGHLPALFGFLYLLQLGALVLLKKRGWWYQAAIADAGGLLWAAFLITLIDGDRSVAGAYAIPPFLIATAWTAIWALESRGGALRSVEMLWTTRATSIACSGLMALLLVTGGFAMTDWFFALLLAGSHLLAARLWSAEDVPAYLGAAAMVAAYALWSPFGWDPASGLVVDRSGEMMAVGLLFGGALLFGGWYMAHGAERPTRWAALSTLGSGFIFGGAYWQLSDHPMLFSWPVLAAGLASIHMGLAQRLDRLRRDDPAYVGAFALHCLAVSGFIAIAIPMQLEKSWIAIAWSLELPVIAWVAGRLDIPWLRRAIWPGAALVLGGIWFSGFPAGDTLVFNWLLYGLGIPLVSFVLTAGQLAATPEQDLRKALQAGAAILGFGLLGLEVDHFFHHLDIIDPDFLAHGVEAIAWLVAAHVLLLAGDRRRAPLLHDSALVVAALAGLWLLACPLFLENPLFSRVFVGGTPVFNRIAAVYGLPALLMLGLAASLMNRTDMGTKGRAGYRIAGVYGLVLGFICASLLVRQAVHGGYISIFAYPVTDAELYGYSAAWTVYGVALLGLGIRMRAQSLRYASAVVVLLTILKAGLVDASDLTGLYRVASFLGLGVALIGIGYLYQRILLRKPGGDAPSLLDPGNAKDVG